jgi:choline dehydrogenase-like flavoprotein
VFDPNVFSIDYGEDKRELRDASDDVHSLDLLSLVQILKFVRGVVNSEPLSSIIQAQHIPPQVPQTDEEWKTFIRQSVSVGNCYSTPCIPRSSTVSQSISHPVGTAVLAPRELNGVVDSNLLVYGTQNVRVIDASIFPYVSQHL